MLIFPVCKINLGLSVLGKRSDGFHDMESVLYPVLLRDALDIVPASDTTHFQISGSEIPGNIEDNLVLKAYQLLDQDYKIGPVKIHLHKKIPTGAGLGGGSSDAASTLVLLNHLFSFGLSMDDLEEYARQLGSDCPFFIRNLPSLVSGRGDRLTPLDIHLEDYNLLIVKARVHINTASAYSWVQPSRNRIPLIEQIALPVETWDGQVQNDFEGPVFSRFPELMAIKNRIKGLGAVYASLTGTGSAVYGLFHKSISIPQSLDFPGCFTWYSGTERK